MALQTPSPTLYVTNIESKIKKPELRSALYALFNPYGQIIDIVAKKHGGGRGQAFVVFAEQTAATSALRGLSGEVFYGKNLDIVYAKTTSNATLSRQDPSKSREAAAIQAARLVVSRAQGEYEQLEKERQEQEAGLGKRVLDDEARAEGDGPSKKPKRDEEEEEEEMEMEMEDEDDAAPSDGSVWLICTNLPPECNEDIMGALYSQHAGFKSASANTSPAPSTHPAPNANAKSFRIAFTSKQQADAAAQATKGFLMQPGWAMGVSVQA